MAVVVVGKECVCVCVFRGGGGFREADGLVSSPKALARVSLKETMTRRDECFEMG